MQQGILIIILAMYAVEDMKKQMITTRYLYLCAAAGLLLQWCTNHLGWMELLAGGAVGMGLLGISVVTKESIGRGDGMLFVVTGIFLGGKENLKLLFLSLLYASLFSLGILVLKKGSRKQEIPFVPFVLLGYATMLLGVRL